MVSFADAKAKKGQHADTGEGFFLQAIQHLLQQGRATLEVFCDEGNVAIRGGDQLAEFGIGFFGSTGCFSLLRLFLCLGHACFQGVAVTADRGQRSIHTFQGIRAGGIRPAQHAESTRIQRSHLHQKLNRLGIRRPEPQPEAGASEP